jgi:hypothetical protein
MENENFIESLIDWSKFDANYKIAERTNGVTKELIELEVDLWQRQLELLPILNYDKIFDEVSKWDISIPGDFSFESVAKAYARNSKYKLRVCNLLAQAQTWTETCESACKYLEELALGAYTGTANDKKSNAKLIIKPFIHLKIQTSRIENYLEKIHSSIIFNANQLDLIIKEKQSKAKLNHRLIADGESSYFSSNETIEENGDVFLPVNKKR